MFDSYEGNTEDYSNLKSDNKEHARTSIESLKRFAREMAATPTDTVKRKQIKAWMRDPYRRAPNKAQYWPQPNDKARRELEDSLVYLKSLSADPKFSSELESESGKQQNAGRSPIVSGGWYAYELNDPAEAERADGDVSGQGDALDFSLLSDGQCRFESHGTQYMGQISCYKDYNAISVEMKLTPPDFEARPEDIPKLKAERSRRFASYKERVGPKRRWRGMEEWDAVAKADEAMANGLIRKPRNSSAKPLPPIVDLQAMFVVDAEDRLINRRLRREVTGKKVKIAGQLYETSRVKFAVATERDPGTKMVRGSVATHFRGAEGSTVNVTPDNGDMEPWELERYARIKARVKVSGKSITVGIYSSEKQAQEAARLYIKALDMGQS